MILHTILTIKVSNLTNYAHIIKILIYEHLIFNIMTYLFYNGLKYNKFEIL
jgi:hypothetical protein